MAYYFMVKTAGNAGKYEKQNKKSVRTSLDAKRSHEMVLRSD